MSSGALKGIEVALIAGAVAWFAYSQLNALKRDTTKPATSEDQSPGTTADEDASQPGPDGKGGEPGNSP